MCIEREREGEMGGGCVIVMQTIRDNYDTSTPTFALMPSFPLSFVLKPPTPPKQTKILPSPLHKIKLK
jgi:hypothetical protein